MRWPRSSKMMGLMSWWINEEILHLVEHLNEKKTTYALKKTPKTPSIIPVPYCNLLTKSVPTDPISNVSILLSKED